MATTVADRKLFVAGEWVETGEWLEVKSPYSGEVVGRVAKAGAAETKRAIDAAEEEPQEAHVVAPFGLRDGPGGQLVQDQPVLLRRQEERRLASPQPEGRPSGSVPPDGCDVDPGAAGLLQGARLPALENLLGDLARDGYVAQEDPEDDNLPDRVQGDERRGVDPGPHGQPWDHRRARSRSLRSSSTEARKKGMPLAAASSAISRIVTPA